MAIVRISEIKKLPKQELAEKQKELRKELLKLNAQRSTGTLASPGKIKALKQAIAKINTVQKATNA
jgi:ribosomal protein L29